MQALLDIAPAIVAVRRGRWPALILLAVAARIALDPGANKHYAAGIAVGALVCDVAGSCWRWPWWTAGAIVTLCVSRCIPLPASVHGRLTLAYCLACITVLLGRRASSLDSREGDDVGGARRPPRDVAQKQRAVALSGHSRQRGRRLLKRS